MPYADRDTHSQSIKIVFSVYDYFKMLAEKPDLTCNFFETDSKNSS